MHILRFTRRVAAPVIAALAAFAAAPVMAQAAAKGVAAWYYARGQSDEWRRNGEHCLRFLREAESIEAALVQLNRRNPRDGAVVRELNARTEERDQYLIRFRDCVNTANRFAEPPARPTPGPQSAWIDGTRGIFVDEKGTRWQSRTQLTSPSKQLFRLDTSMPPVSAVAQYSLPVAEYIGQRGSRMREYGVRLSPERHQKP